MNVPAILTDPPRLCDGCGKPMTLAREGESFIGFTDGRCYHAGCYQQPRAAQPTREQIIRNVQDRISRRSRGFGYPELGAIWTKSELRCAAEAAVEELAPYLPKET